MTDREKDILREIDMIIKDNERLLAENADLYRINQRQAREIEELRNRLALTGGNG